MLVWSSCCYLCAAQTTGLAIPKFISSRDPLSLPRICAISLEARPSCDDGLDQLDIFSSPRVPTHYRRSIQGTYRELCLVAVELNFHKYIHYEYHSLVTISTPAFVPPNLDSDRCSTVTFRLGRGFRGMIRRLVLRCRSRHFCSLMMRCLGFCDIIFTFHGFGSCYLFLVLGY